MSIWYTTREVVKSATDSKSTARDDAQVDRAIDAASRTAETICHRVFVPRVATRMWPWPDRQNGSTWRLWLNQHDLISVDSITSGGETLDVGDWYLEPVNDGPPYTSIEVNRDTIGSWSSGDNPQRAIEVTGLWGFDDVETTAGTLTADVTASATVVPASVGVGVGSVLRLGGERVVVTGSALADTAATITSDVDVRANAELIPYTGTIHAGEVITVDAERMLVTAVAGSNLIVDRAWDGSTLAAHTTGAPIWAPRSLTVERAALGTTATAHTNGTVVHRWMPPAPVVAYVVAAAVTQVQQEQAAYARTVGSGENERESAGRGLKHAAADLYAACGRKMRMRSV